MNSGIHPEFWIAIYSALGTILVLNFSPKTPWPTVTDRMLLSLACLVSTCILFILVELRNLKHWASNLICIDIV